MQVVVGENSPKPRDQSLLCLHVSLHVQQIFVYKTLAFPSPVWIVFLAFEVLNHYPQHLPLSLTDDDI